MLEYKTFGGGYLGSNTYLVFEADTGEGMIIDLGNSAADIINFADERSIKIKYLVLTHGHYDHVRKMEEYRTRLPEAKVVSHRDEACVLTDPEANVSTLFRDPKAYRTADVSVAEGDEISLGSQTFKVLSTPGHTPGSICLYSEENKLMFTGDTLFAEGWGRTDFKYGDEALMHKSLTRLLSMDGDIVFLAGHGAPSTVGARGARGIYDF